MILAAAVEGTEGIFGCFGRGCCCHRVMAMHRRLAGLSRRLDRLAHAVHGLRLIRASQRQRPEGREEHSQQQKSRSPTIHRFCRRCVGWGCRREKSHIQWKTAYYGLDDTFYGFLVAGEVLRRCPCTVPVAGPTPVPAGNRKKFSPLKRLILTGTCSGLTPSTPAVIWR
jgi:hypothetical protein